MTIAEKMKQYIDENGLKQKAIAQRASMREDAVSNMLRSKRKMTVDEYISICHAIGVPPQKFLDGEGKR